VHVRVMVKVISDAFNGSVLDRKQETAELTWPARFCEIYRNSSRVFRSARAYIICSLVANLSKIQGLYREYIKNQEQQAIIKVYIKFIL
jgi:hypothetical protein